MNRVDVHVQRDRELKKGEKVARMGRGSQGTREGRIKLRTRAEIKEGAIKDEEAAGEASGRKLSEVCSFVLVI